MGSRLNGTLEPVKDVDITLDRDCHTTFSAPIVSSSLNFNQEELKVLELWKQLNAFDRQLELTKDLPRYTFYDGPPFATGLPHYGHLLAGTIKDVVTRYAATTGHYVERRFGWVRCWLETFFRDHPKLTTRSLVPGHTRPPRRIRNRQKARHQRPRRRPENGNRQVQRGMPVHRHAILERMGAHCESDGTVD